MSQNTGYGYGYGYGYEQGHGQGQGQGGEVQYRSVKPLAGPDIVDSGPCGRGGLGGPRDRTNQDAPGPDPWNLAERGPHPAVHFVHDVHDVHTLRHAPGTDTGLI